MNKISEHANYLLNEYGRLQFDYAFLCKPYGESLRNEARNNLEEYIAGLETRDKRIAELEGKIDQLTAHSDIERQKEGGMQVTIEGVRAFDDVIGKGFGIHIGWFDDDA